MDADRGIIVANYTNIPNYSQLIPQEETDWPIITDGGSSGEGAGGNAPQHGAPYSIHLNAGWRAPYTGMPCTQPPCGGIRAIDIETGETFRQDVLPAGGQANPIAFEANGRQLVMIAAGGHHFMGTGVSDAIIAYALPERFDGLIPYTFPGLGHHRIARLMRAAKAAFPCRADRHAHPKGHGLKHALNSESVTGSRLCPARHGRSQRSPARD